MNLRLFSKPHCPWRHAAQDWRNQRGIKCQTLDVIADSKAMTEMVKQ